MEFELRRRHERVELTIKDGNTTITSDYWNGQEIGELINQLEEILDELNEQQDNGRHD